jgi:very-short-patch-repair endonuclease
VVSRPQLLALGLTSSAFNRWLAEGRLHRIFAGVYAVGRPQLTREGRWMAAVLACGGHAAISGETAIAAFGVGHGSGSIEVTVPAHVHPRCPGITVRRRRGFGPAHVVVRDGTPVTNIVLALVDFAARHGRARVERAINEADKLGLITPERLRAGIEEYTGWPGVPLLRGLLDRYAFLLTDSELERLFLPIARRAGLGSPLTQAVVHGYRVDFYWPELGLIVETDGLRYHRTAAQQSRDRLRDQVHVAAGLTPLRFTHWQARYQAAEVERTLIAVAARLRAA